MPHLGRSLLWPVDRDDVEPDGPVRVFAATLEVGRETREPVTLLVIDALLRRVMLPRSATTIRPWRRTIATRAREKTAGW